MIPTLDHIELIATGCVVVMAALAVLWLFTAIVGSAFIRHAGHSAAPVAVGPAEVAADHRVAIAAAVAVALQGRPHRIVRIDAPAFRAPGWRRVIP